MRPTYERGCEQMLIDVFKGIWQEEVENVTQIVSNRMAE